MSDENEKGTDFASPILAGMLARTKNEKGVKCIFHRVDGMGHKCMNSNHDSRYCEYAPLDMEECPDLKEAEEE